MDTNKIFFLGTERMDMNSLVPFRPVPQGRIELRHALTQTHVGVDVYQVENRRQKSRSFSNGKK